MDVARCGEMRCLVQPYQIKAVPLALPPSGLRCDARLARSRRAPISSRTSTTLIRHAVGFWTELSPRSAAQISR